MTDDREPMIRDDIPASARVYGWALGGKDNYQVDRDFALKTAPAFPESIDISRQNRLFLYRAVRYLATEAGIRQFLDMGCGLPTNNNVHQVAQRFTPDARVVYVDIDPIVLAYGRALLAGDGSTIVINADFRDQEALLAHPDVRRLIDFDEPLAVLFLSVGHHLTDADDPRGILHNVMDRAAPGSHLAFSQIVCSDPDRAADLEARMSAAGIPWQNRTREQVHALLENGLEPVEPGLVNLLHWRPDPDQPPLPPVPDELAQFVGASRMGRDMCEYGGVLRKP
ncbi:SAM-dependent methyltransferase [Actinomadura formosensis]|uniref:SAM-dependent methyltransferase n=1 Tax=Actinomadura formosensis TaxID=60706 RepID=UPI000A511CB4|nr:SAM-dependent methyltransferase [Actinomadura formosensis]